MHAKSKTNDAEKVAVDRRELVQTWSLLETLVVSIDKIGSAHSLPSKEHFTKQLEQAMLADIGRFVLDQIFDDANRLRIALGEYLPDDEAEELSDRLNIWQPQQR
jgi:hypothetical protein